MLASKCCPVRTITSCIFGNFAISRLTAAALMNCGRAPTIVIMLRQVILLESIIIYLAHCQFIRERKLFIQVKTT